jgi:GLPGLI family protein
MKPQRLFLFLIGSVLAIPALAQKMMSEGTLVYTISVQTGSKEPQMADMFDGASTTIYLKGGLSRSDMVTALGTSTTIYDSRSGSGAVLKEYSGQKLLIKMNRNNWLDKNKKYEGISFTPTNETKIIAGYTCKKAIAKLKDGTSFTVYYTTDLTTENKEYDYQFKTLPGLALEYESTVGNLHVRYTASKINFDPVPAQRFAVPQSGYRELTYEESSKAGQ